MSGSVQRGNGGRLQHPGGRWLAASALGLCAALGCPTASRAQGLDPEATPTAPAGPASPGAAEPGTRLPVRPHAPSSGYDDGGFFILGDEGRYRLGLAARMQMLYELDCRDEGVERCGERFSLTRVQLGISGHALTPALRYVLTTELGKGSAYLKDGYLDARLLPGALHLRLGQWKRPFSRQQITSDGKLELVDRSLLEKASETGRDIGLALHDDYERSPRFEWALGLFNGTSAVPRLQGEAYPEDGSGRQTVQGKLTNVPERFRPALVLRLGYNHGRIAGYSEGDFEGGPLRFGVGASGLCELDADRDETAAARAELDTVIKLHGFAASGGVYLMSARPGSALEDLDFTGMGYFAQAGYLIAGRYQPVARYTALRPDRADVATTERALGLSVYLARHDLKWQTDYAHRRTQSGESTEDEHVLRSQVQLGF